MSPEDRTPPPFPEEWTESDVIEAAIKVLRTDRDGESEGKIFGTSRGHRVVVALKHRGTSGYRVSAMISRDGHDGRLNS